MPKQTRASAPERKTTAATAAPRRRRAYMPAAERRKQIIQAAQQVFAHTSLHSARTRQLAQAAEVNQATLFEHFASKEELFAAAVLQPMREAMQGMRERAEAYQHASTGKDLLALGQASARRHIESMCEIYPLLATALFSDPKLGRKLYREQIVPMIRERGAVMRKVVKDDTDPELLALAAFGMFFAVAMDRTFRGRKDSLDSIADQLTSLLGFGFVPDRLR